MSNTLKRVIGLACAGLMGWLLSACSPVGVINGLTPTGSFEKTSDIAYGADPRQTLDIYRPRQPAPGAPVVVFFYGGRWNSGSRSDYLFVGEALASRGITTVIADYRLYPQVRYPEFLVDGAQAVSWTYRHIGEYGGNPQRLYLMGHSAGAYNVAMLALDAQWLKAVGLSPANVRGWIGLAGPYDFLPIKDEAVRPVFFYPDSPPESQPIRHVSHASPPTLLMAAATDTLVNPTRNTGGLASALRGAQVPVQELYFSRTSHVTLVAALSRPLRWLAPVLDNVSEFVTATP